MSQLNQAGCHDVSVPGSRDYDLVQMDTVRQLYADTRPDVVLHLAARVGATGTTSPTGAVVGNEAVSVTVIIVAWRPDGRNQKTNWHAVSPPHFACLGSHDSIAPVWLARIAPGDVIEGDCSPYCVLKWRSHKKRAITLRKPESTSLMCGMPGARTQPPPGQRNHAVLHGRRPLPYEPHAAYRRHTACATHR